MKYEKIKDFEPPKIKHIFRAGDRVKVISSPYSIIKPGTIGTIVHTFLDYSKYVRIEIDHPPHSWYYILTEKEIEKI